MDEATGGNHGEDHEATAAQAARVLADPARARPRPWGLGEYGEILALQQRLHAERAADRIADTWLAGEHPAVATMGVRGAEDDLLRAGALPVFKIDRGGQTTIHNPGQLVIYPIVKVQPGLLAQARISRLLLVSVREWLAELAGVDLTLEKGRPGLFAPDGRKVAAIGVAIHQRVSMHGIAINLCNDLTPWDAIVACGEPGRRPATLSELAGRRIEPGELLATMAAWLKRAWGYEEIEEGGA